MLSTNGQIYYLPQQATLGGAETMYPEYGAVLRKQYSIPPGYCTQDCCGTGIDLIHREKALQCGMPATTPNSRH